MTKLTAFEIRIQKDGIWKIDSLFDERELAVSEAKRLGKSRRYDAVLVVEETFNEDTGRTNTRTIYRSGKRDEQPESSDSPDIEAWRRRRQRRGPPSPPKKSVTGQVIAKAFLLVAIAGLGLGLVYFLNFLL